jgi:hypothetical protein
MTGMTIEVFMDKVYHGDEIEFCLDGITYFVQGNRSGNKYTLTVDYWRGTDGTEPHHDYLLVLECASPMERLHKFESAKVFGGRNIYEAESEIIVQYG